MISCALRKSHLIARNASFCRNALSSFKCSVLLYARTHANMTNEPKKSYEKVKNQDTRKIDETENDANTKKDRIDNSEYNIKKTIYGTLLFGCFIISITAMLLCIDKFLYNFSWSIYKRALIHCSKDPKIVNVLGEPINIVRQKKHITNVHRVYQKNGAHYEKLTFYIVGPKGKGLVEVEMKNESDRYECTDLQVTVSDVDTFQVVPKQENLDKEFWSLSMIKFFLSNCSALRNN